MTEEEKKAVEEAEKAAAQKKLDDAKLEAEKVAGEAEARIEALEKEKAQAIVEMSNWKLAALKAKGKIKKEDPDSEDGEEGQPDVRAIIQEELSKTRIGQIDAEKDVLLKRLAKENKELKLAQASKTTIVTATGASDEGGAKVQDHLVTPQQIEAFKKMGWTDKDIERYKKNLSRKI